jgi:hypothetical protein
MFSSPASNSCSAHTSPVSLVDPNTSADGTLTQLINIKVDTNVIGMSLVPTFNIQTLNSVF